MIHQYRNPDLDFKGRGLQVLHGVCMYLLLQAALLYLGLLYGFWERSYVFQRGGKGRLKDRMFDPYLWFFWQLFDPISQMTGLGGATGHPAALLSQLPGSPYEPNALWQDMVSVHGIT